MKHRLIFASLSLLTSAVAQTLNDGSVLPFPPPKSLSVVKPRLQDSSMRWPTPAQHLPKDAPNILIVLLDDVGFGVSETFGGEVHTPTLTKLASGGIRYNAFHTTSILLAHAGGASDGKKSYARKLRHDRRTSCRI
jgi:arylsulfatase